MIDKSSILFSSMRLKKKRNKKNFKYIKGLVAKLATRVRKQRKKKKQSKSEWIFLEEGDGWFFSEIDRLDGFVNENLIVRFERARWIRKCCVSAT